MTSDKDDLISKKEMYEFLLKEFNEFKDEGREAYLDEILEKIRKELEL